MLPRLDLDKIKFATDAPTFERAVKLYEDGKVTKFKDSGFAYTAKVLGTHPYDVIVSKRRYEEASCTCYLGQHDTLCKHMVAVSIYAVKNGKPLTKTDKELVEGPVSSGRLGILNKKEFAETKKSITAAMRYIKPYTGPSRIWFAYQDSLSEGCRRLSAIVSGLPISEQTAKLLINMLLRLDKKLSTGGADDSDGTVGGFIEEVVKVLMDYARLDASCIEAFKTLTDRETCFGWEEALVRLFDERGN